MNKPLQMFLRKDEIETALNALELYAGMVSSPSAKARALNLATRLMVMDGFNEMEGSDDE